MQRPLRYGSAISVSRFSIIPNCKTDPSGQEATWDAFSHWQWSYRLFVDSDHEFMRRADAATDWLESHARQSASVAVVMHAGFRRLVAARLVARGWRHGPSKRGYENWSAWEFLRT